MNENSKKLEDLQGALIRDALDKSGDERKALIPQIIEITKVLNEQCKVSSEIRLKEKQIMNDAMKQAEDSENANKDRIMRLATWALGGVGTTVGSVLLLTRVVFPFEKGECIGSFAGKAVMNSVLKKMIFIK